MREPFTNYHRAKEYVKMARDMRARGQHQLANQLIHLASQTMETPRSVFDALLRAVTKDPAP